MEYIFNVDDPNKTQKLGESLAKYLEPGDFIAMFGDLGSGKTCMTKGIARGLGVTSEITSPTFTFVHEHKTGRLMLYHFDVYRINRPEELESIGYDEYFYGDGVSVCEWSELIPEYLPKDRIEIHFEKTGNEERKITIITDRDLKDIK